MVAATLGNGRTCSFETSSSYINVNYDTKSETASNETKRNRRKRPLRSSARSSNYTNSMNMSMSSSDFSLDTITEFPYLEDKFSLPCSLFSLDDDNISSTSTVRTTKNSISQHLGIVLNALNVLGIDSDSEEESDDDYSTPSVASFSDDESEDSNIREDEERRILRDSRWGNKECNSSSIALPTRNLNNGDCAPTCPVRRR